MGLQMVGTLKMNGTARTGAFSADGTQLLTSGGDGTGKKVTWPVCSHLLPVYVTGGRVYVGRPLPNLPACCLHCFAVYVWDLRTQRCMQRYQDEGCLNSANMSCSPDGTLFATGTGMHPAKINITVIVIAQHCRVGGHSALCCRFQ
jgi:U3 small nucleolar RNA-associated protein 18